MLGLGREQVVGGGVDVQPGADVVEAEGAILVGTAYHPVGAEVFTVHRSYLEGGLVAGVVNVEQAVAFGIVEHVGALNADVVLVGYVGVAYLVVFEGGLLEGILEGAYVGGAAVVVGGDDVGNVLYAIAAHLSGVVNEFAGIGQDDCFAGLVDVADGLVVVGIAEGLVDAFLLGIEVDGVNALKAAGNGHIA